MDKKLREEILEHAHEILNDVFGYRSNNNGPFWSIFTPQFLNSYIGYYKLFLIAVFLLGFFVERKKIMETFLIYLLETLFKELTNSFLFSCQTTVGNLDI